MSPRPAGRPDGPPGVGDQVLAELVSELPDAVVVIDRVCTVKWGNKAAERLVGRTLLEAVGVSGLELVHPDDLELVLRSLETVQTKKVGTPIEVRVNTRSGWRLVELIGTPIPWFEEGAVLLGIRDLTQRRRYELAHDEVERFRSLVHNAAAVTMLLSAQGVILSVSGALTRLLGHDPELVEGTELSRLVDESERSALSDALERALEGATAVNPVKVPVRLKRYGISETVPFEISIVNLLDDPTVSGLVISCHDMTARAKVEAELRDTLSLLSATLESTADGILVVDAAGRITSHNRRFAEMWQLPEQVLTDRDDAQALSYVLDQLVRPQEFVAKVEELYAQPEASSHDTLEFLDGRVFERYSQPQLVEGEVVGRVWSFRDVTDRKRLENELSYQAFHDPLTGLANKRLFQDRLQHAVARIGRTKGNLAVLFLDLDNFKTVNDSLGHSMGDELLRKVADLLVDCLRSADTAARLGGDEFAVLVEDVNQRSDVFLLTERLLDVFRRPVTVGTKEVSATVSIGVAFNTPGMTSDQLLRNADLAMYRAKERGKNRHEQFAEEMHEAVVARLEVEADLRRAIDGDEFVVYYQPIVDLNTGEVEGFEALARWRHPLRGLLTPGAFVPLAEEIGLIERIDRCVLIEACSQLRRWQLEFPELGDLSISVNLSSRQLVDAALADDVAVLLRRIALAPENLILEITESGMMRDTEAAVRNLRMLKALGVRIALDDFGTGYASLTYLERLPVDILKIDQSFVGALETDGDEIGLAPAIVQLARTLGHVPIAEGVESPAQVEHLRRLGCRLAQGFHLGVPVHADAAHELLVGRRRVESRI
jgi:diguanylate cyclase (GGDEF)-like protein/PAS domain S-box-containing protein